jgi:hypothetical protein
VRVDGLRVRCGWDTSLFAAALMLLPDKYERQRPEIQAASLVRRRRDIASAIDAA